MGYVHSLSNGFVPLSYRLVEVLTLKPLVSYLLFMVEIGKEYDVAKELKKLPGVTEAQVVYGEFDLVARVELSDFSLLDETVTMARRLPGVTRTSTLISSGIQT
jgi:DNA-binding Lrp family transcriptional regulator